MTTVFCIALPCKTNLTSLSCLPTSSFCPPGAAGAQPRALLRLLPGETLPDHGALPGAGAGQQGGGGAGGQAGATGAGRQGGAGGQARASGAGE